MCSDPLLPCTRWGMFALIQLKNFSEVIRRVLQYAVKRSHFPRWLNRVGLGRPTLASIKVESYRRSCTTNLDLLQHQPLAPDTLHYITSCPHLFPRLPQSHSSDTLSRLIASSRCSRSASCRSNMARYISSISLVRFLPITPRRGFPADNRLRNESRVHFHPGASP